MATELRAQNFSHLHELPSVSNFLRLKCFSFIHYSEKDSLLFKMKLLWLPHN